MARFKKVQETGWRLNSELLELLDEAIEIETDEDTRSEDVFMHVSHRAKKYGLDALYQPWLVETWTSHATLRSATPYFDYDEDLSASHLYTDPKPTMEQPLRAICVGVLVAFAGYEQLNPDLFGERLADWERRLSYRTSGAQSLRLSDEQERVSDSSTHESEAEESDS